MCPAVPAPQKKIAEFFWGETTERGQEIIDKDNLYRIKIIGSNRAGSLGEQKPKFLRTGTELNEQRVLDHDLLDYPTSA